jgi:hypothetical protein
VQNIPQPYEDTSKFPLDIGALLTYRAAWKDFVIHYSLTFLKAISKPQMVSDGKARADEKAQHTREYVSILKRCST